MKYFITGRLLLRLLLYGVALLYGTSGSTWLARIAPALQPSSSSPALGSLGAALLLVGFGFKVASVPFHMWVPDGYEGAPTTVTALMSAGVKAAAFGAFLRVFLVPLSALSGQWRPAVACWRS
jgi:NADH-quinone oxidoreductase subunit N